MLSPMVGHQICNLDVAGSSPVPNRRLSSVSPPGPLRASGGGPGGGVSALEGSPMIRFLRIRPFEVGLVFRDGAFHGLLGPGTYWRFDPLRRERIDVVNRRAPWLAHEQL